MIFTLSLLRGRNHPGMANLLDPLPANEPYRMEAGSGSGYVRLLHTQLVGPVSQVPGYPE